MANYLPKLGDVVVSSDKKTSIQKGKKDGRNENDDGEGTGEKNRTTNRSIDTITESNILWFKSSLWH